MRLWRNGALALAVAEFDKYLRDDIVKWGNIVRSANIKPE